MPWHLSAGLLILEKPSPLELHGENSRYLPMAFEIDLELQYISIFVKNITYEILRLNVLAFHTEICIVPWNSPLGD